MPKTTTGKGQSGFTLVEIVVVIAVISILASMAVPFASKMLDSARETSTRQRMQDINKAIVGDPATGTYGFVGDMGRLPTGTATTALTQLNTRAAQPASVAGQLGVLIGWNGPYVTSGFDAAGVMNDGWGRPLRYGPAPTALAVVPDTGNYPALLAGQIYSVGADRVAGSADDILFLPAPSAPVNINGRLLVNVFAWDCTVAQFVSNPKVATYPGIVASVTVYYANNGAQGNLVLSAPAASPPYQFGPMPAGMHAVVGACTLPGRTATSGQAIIAVPSNNQQTVLNLYLR